MPILPVAPRTTRRSWTLRATSSRHGLRCLGQNMMMNKEEINCWEAGFSPANIRAGFKKTGIYPFNPDAYKDMGCDTRGGQAEAEPSPLDMLCTAACDPRAAGDDVAQVGRVCVFLFAAFNVGDNDALDVVSCDGVRRVAPRL